MQSSGDCIQGLDKNNHQGRACIREPLLPVLLRCSGSHLRQRTQPATSIHHPQQTFIILCDHRNTDAHIAQQKDVVAAVVGKTYIALHIQGVIPSCLVSFFSLSQY